MTFFLELRPDTEGRRLPVPANVKEARSWLSRGISRRGRALTERERTYLLDVVKLNGKRRPRGRR